MTKCYHGRKDPQEFAAALVPALAQSTSPNWWTPADGRATAPTPNRSRRPRGHDRRAIDPSRPPGFLKGRFELCVDEDTHMLKTGQSLAFTTPCSYGWGNQSRAPAVVLWAFSPSAL